jgi:hypothetical protein
MEVYANPRNLRIEKRNPISPVPIRRLVGSSVVRNLFGLVYKVFKVVAGFPEIRLLKSAKSE